MNNKTLEKKQSLNLQTPLQERSKLTMTQGFNNTNRPNVNNNPTINTDVPNTNTGNNQAQRPGFVQGTGQSAPAGTGGTSYAPSQNVAQAQSSLNSIIASRPGEFNSGYTAQLDEIYNMILGREAFKYDLANDPMYQQYRQQYMQAGRNAMADTMGQAASLTGGYGSSYAATAGQQAYNQQLQQLNDRIPELYQMSRDAYDAEGDALYQRYALANDAYNRDYSEWQDAYDRWQNDRQFAQNAYEADRNYQLQNESLALDRLSLQQQQANADRDYALAERDYANADRDYYFDLSMAMLDMGKTPPDSILLQAGLTQEEIEALRKTEKRSSGSSSSKKSGSGSSTGSADYQSIIEKMRKAAAAKKNSTKISTYTYPGTSLGSIMRN